VGGQFGEVGLAAFNLGAFFVTQIVGEEAAFGLEHKVEALGAVFVHEQGQPVADAEIVLIKGHPLLHVGDIARDGELGAACLLPTKQVADRFDGLELVVEVGFEVEFHG